MILNDGTKGYILETYNQISVFAAYLEIDESSIEYCLEHPSNKIHNPLRVDNHPSFGLFQTTDRETSLSKIRMHDYAYRQYRGDCFDLVGLIRHLNPSYKDHFKRICFDIIATMEEYNGTHKTKITTPVAREITTNRIKIDTRIFNSNDIHYWDKRFHLNEHDLMVGKVWAVYAAYLNDEFIYSNNLSDPCYAYYLDTANGAVLYKLYFPFRKGVKYKARFITNNNVFPIECVHEMKRADILMLTKARKDVLVMRKLLTKINTNYSIQVNNLTGESVILTDEYMAKLKTIYKYIFVNTDFDYTGITTGNEYKRKHGILRFIPTIGKYGTSNMGGKDISEILDNKGEEAALRILRTAYNFIDNYIKSKEITSQHEPSTSERDAPL